MSILNVKMSSTVHEAIKSAPTPEEAYKVFCAAATKGIGDAVADALKKALGDVQAMRNDVPWTKWIGDGITLDWAWSTPPTAGPSNKIIMCKGIEDVKGPHAMGIDVSVSIGAHF